MTTPSSAQIATRNRAQAQQLPPSQRRTYVLHPSQYTSSTAPPPTGASAPRPGNRFYINVQNKQAEVKPRFMGTQRTILFAWVVAMGFIAADEWRTYQVLPRPSRLWWATLTYAILAIVSQIEILIPLTNALALGYTIMLAWQFFNGGGQFGRATAGMGSAGPVA